MAGTVERTRLDNGVRIVTQPMPDRRSVSMGVWVSVGARDEAPAESGMSHMIEHMIFKGTERRSGYQIAKAFDAIGGQTNAFTSLETTCYHAKVMDVHLDAMVDILSDIFLNSVFDPAEIDRERQVVLQEIRMLEESPEDLVHTLSGETFWGGHPLGRSILGTPENLQGFDAPGLRAFFRHNYRPGRIVIAAAGHLTHEAFVDRVAPDFAHLPPDADATPRHPPVDRPRLIVHHRPVEQVHLCLTGPGLAITDERRYAFSLLNTILGGNMSSRLFQTIRECHGLAYTVYSFVSSYQDTGMLGIYAAVSPGRLAETLERILDTLAGLAREPVGAQRLQAAKEYTQGNLVLAAESNDHQMVRLGQNEIYFGRHTPLAEVARRIDAVGAEELMALAGELCRPEGLGLTLVGPVPAGSVPVERMPHWSASDAGRAP